MTSVRNSPAQLDALDEALHSGDEGMVVQELRKVRSETQPRSKWVQKVVQILRETPSPRVRNAAAVALADMHANREADVIVKLLSDPKTQSSRGTLLYALEELGKSVPLGILIDIVLGGSYEARQEALGLIAAGNVICSEVELREAEYRIKRLPDSLTEEQRASAHKALQLLSSLSGGNTAIAEPHTAFGFQTGIFKVAPSSTVTLKDFAASLSEMHQLPKRQVKTFLNYFVVLVTDHLKKGRRVRIRGLGTFIVRKRAGRLGRNPATGELMKIRASRTVRFRPAEELKNEVSGTQPSADYRSLSGS